MKQSQEVCRGLPERLTSSPTNWSMSQEVGVPFLFEPNFNVTLTGPVVTAVRMQAENLNLLYPSER